MNRRLLLFPAIAVIAALAIWQPRPATPGGGVPACTWRIGNGTDIRQGRPFDELPADSPMRLSCWCDEPRYVYVFAHSAEDGTLLLWPSPLLKSDLPQPLAAGTNVLPGKHQDKELAWTTRSGIRAVTTFVVVAARQPVAELDALVPRVRQWSNTVFTDSSMQVTKPSTSVELLGPPGSGEFASPLLQRTAKRDLGNTLPNGPLQPDTTLPDVWTGSWTCIEKKP